MGGPRRVSVSVALVVRGAVAAVAVAVGAVPVPPAADDDVAEAVVVAGAASETAALDGAVDGGAFNDMGGGALPPRAGIIGDAPAISTT